MQRRLLFALKLDTQVAPAIVEHLDAGHTLRLDDVFRDPRNRDQRLRCVPLVLHRGGTRHVMPPSDTPLELDDELLVCATQDGQRRLRAALTNHYLLDYLVTGVVRSRGTVFGWFRPARARSGS